MIVYGDPSFSRSLPELVSSLCECGRAVESSLADSQQSLDALRRCLIEAGELEQAVEDSGEIEPRLVTALRSTNDRVAEAFCGTSLGDVDSPAKVDRALRSINELSKSENQQTDGIVRVKVPEGFAFYTLFPEQYIASVALWAAGQQTQRARVAVIGIRSIGTTLSAVVCAALRAKWWAAHRLTVRPSGHAFDRRVNFQSAELNDAQFAIVVDEGPGASGSSMAAVARGLVDAGFDPKRVCFLPGHGAEPGPHASAEVRQWWSTIPRFSTALKDLRWNGRSLTQNLAEQTEKLLAGAAVDRIEDLSGGLWRDVLFANADPQPPAFPAFERTKYRCVLRDGRAVLWKFVGFGADAQNFNTQMIARADAGWTSRPIGTCLGFVGLPWIDGKTLFRKGASPQVLDQIGRYIRESAGAVLNPQEASEAFERLREMLYWNAWESLGEDAAQRCRHLSDLAAQQALNQPMSSYGDGRLGPCEWIGTSDGTLHKVDCAGHDSDHTMIGRQPLVWDVAGAVVEWGLNDENTAKLVAAVTPDVSPDLFRFYRAAYAAFRIGMAAMSHVDSTLFRDQLRGALSGATI